VTVPDRTPPSQSPLQASADRLRALGIDRVESFAWRDLDDAEAGGSELHADEIFSRWAAVGIDVVHRTSTREARTFDRNGYVVVQRGGRYDVFARVIASQMWRRLARRRPSSTATLEIWNGVPWFGPLWAPQRRVVWMHHVHRDMWADVLPEPLATAGRFLETRFAPMFYKRSTFATLSESSADEIEEIGIERSHLTVIPPGVHERYTPDESVRSTCPEVVVVGRLAPVKRQRLALAALAAARSQVPDLCVHLIGDGPDRAHIEAWIDEHDAKGWVTLSGRVSDDELVEAYRSAWLVVSASHAEGWGMSLTEGAACATPCVATDIAGHRGAVVDGVTGLLVADIADLGPAVAGLLVQHDLRDAMASAAIEHSAGLSWTAVAARQLDVFYAAVASAASR
jgi:glycosyltransferase involved in cell wall biosynthesis